MCLKPVTADWASTRADRRFARGMMVTLGALIRLAGRARRMLSFLLSYRAAPATKAATI
ncbi:MAG TPA: hypothetical protein VKB62_03065 [Streptosporangiaceae bacterium]|nr:hypothetical protein [Streptosporangiaceae bacterium]